MKRTPFTILIVMTFALVSVMSLSASAKSVRVRIIDSDLTRLPFRKNVEAGLKWVSAKMSAHYGPKIKATIDKADRARLKEQMRRDLKRVKDGLMTFTGKRTGLEVSVVSEQFVHGANESALIYREGQTVHYLFYSQGKLWKYARVLKPKGTFAQRLKSLGRDFGLPTSTKASKGGATSASWVGDKVTMTIEDARKIYGVDLLLVEHRKMASQVAKNRKGKKTGIKPDVDPEIGDILDD